MSWTSLQMISLGSLLLFGERSLCTGGSQCVSEDEANQRLERFQKSRATFRPPLQPVDHPTTCEQVAPLLTGDLTTRSVSPWRYRIDHNINRSPADIAMAECLCKGCILEQKETHDHNSVTVTLPMKVLYKNPCPDHPSKYVMKHEYIRVPVACVCVVPKYRDVRK